MDLKFFPDEAVYITALSNDDPVALLVAHDESELIVAPLDDVAEHIILLRKIGYKETRIDQFYRVIFNKSGADWTFVCPSDYKNISDRGKRIEKFYNDGIDSISKALKLLKLDLKIDIPPRYRRHLKELSRH